MNYRHGTLAFSTVHPFGDKNLMDQIPDSYHASLSPLRKFASKTKNNVCITKACVKLAARFIQNMDETINPCEDFYEFACPGYVKRTKLPDEKSSITAFIEVDDHLQEKLKDVLEESKTADESSTTSLAKTLYRSCINTTQLRKLGLQPLRDILSELGGWPVVEGQSWNALDKFTLVEALYKTDELVYSANVLFSFDVSVDSKNSSIRVIEIDQAKLGLSRIYLIKGLNDSDVQAYLNYSTNSAILLGADADNARAEMMEMLLFEIQLANLSAAQQDRRDSTSLYHIISISDLEQLCPIIPWLEFFKRLFPSSIQIDTDERINVVEPKYMQSLTVLLNNTSSRTLANYILWRTVEESAEYLSSDIRSLRYTFIKTLSGNSAGERWKECVDLVTQKLPIAIGNLYVKNYFKEEAKRAINQLVQYLKSSFDEILNSLDWMDEETRAKALQKSKAIHDEIAYPDEILMDDKLEEYYRNLSVNDGSFLLNIQRINSQLRNYKMGLLRQPVNKTDWKTLESAAIVNAYYDPSKNSITGILQGNFFDPYYPQYVNFASIGDIIGHEITHGFDDQGRQFDSLGNLYNWWNPETEKKFLIKAKCVINQYSNYTLPEIGLQVDWNQHTRRKHSRHRGIERSLFSLSALGK